MSTPTELPTGLAGLKYPITQVSLVVDDIDELLDRYYQAFGWAPWQDFDHVPPLHKNTMYQGRPVSYSLRGAEVYVGSLNFELLKPLPNGESLFHDHLALRGEGIASIASMFHEKADGDAVKVAFKEEFGLEVINLANIGDHIEYYYIDTQRDFGCPIESGSGHAIDFVKPARIFPHTEAKFGGSPSSGITYTISQVTLVTRDLETKVRNYHRAFGWGPWHLYDARQPSVLSEFAVHGDDSRFDGQFAQVRVGDTIFDIVEPNGGSNPWQEFMDENGGGLIGIAVTPAAPATVDDVVEQFSADGIGVLASARVGTAAWRLLDTRDAFKTLIAVTSEHAYDAVRPGSVFPTA